MLLVSHDRGEAYRLCDTVCVLSDGKSEEKTTVRDLMAAPGTVSAALISGCKNFSPVRRVDATHVQCLDWGVTLETSQKVSNICTYAGVRAHSFHIAKSGEPNRFDVFGMMPQLTTAAAMRNPEVVLLGVAPEHVMTLSGEL